jgi:hypothetical protein
MRDLLSLLSFVLGMEIRPKTHNLNTFYAYKFFIIASINFVGIVITTTTLQILDSAYSSGMNLLNWTKF